MSFQTILVPLDGSDHALLSLDRAVELARHDNAKILLLGVVEVPIAHFEGYGEFVAGLDVHQKLREHVSIALHDTVVRLTSEGITAEALVKEGFPHEEICRTCLDEGVDLIVLTTHGRRGFAHLLLGSIAEKVVRMAPCSVLVIRPGPDEGYIRASFPDDVSGQGGIGP